MSGVFVNESAVAKNWRGHVQDLQKRLKEADGRGDTATVKDLRSQISVYERKLTKLHTTSFQP